MEEQKRKEAHARYQASLVGPERAKKLGVQWDLNEDLDPMTDELLLKSSASFTGESDLVIQIEASCLVSKKQLEVTASAFNLKDEGVSFIAETAIDLFGVQRVATKTLVRFDDNKPQEALFAIRNYSNHIHVDINGWLYFYEVRIKFNLDYGAVIAKIAPYEHNLYKVFEACTDKNTPF